MRKMEKQHFIDVWEWTRCTTGWTISADSYNLYVNPLLNILCETEQGGHKGDIGCCALTCADDVAIISSSPV